jgi:F0F1-type ATP synthase epsilon subunit
MVIKIKIHEVLTVETPTKPGSSSAQGISHHHAPIFTHIKHTFASVSAHSSQGSAFVLPLLLDIEKGQN